MAACRTVLPFSTVTGRPSIVSVTVSITGPIISAGGHPPVSGTPGRTGDGALSPGPGAGLESVRFGDTLSQQGRPYGAPRCRPRLAALRRSSSGWSRRPSSAPRSPSPRSSFGTSGSQQNHRRRRLRPPAARRLDPPFRAAAGGLGSGAAVPRWQGDPNRRDTRPPWPPVRPRRGKRPAGSRSRHLGERLTRFYEYGGSRFVVVFEPFERNGEPRVAASTCLASSEFSWTDGVSANAAYFSSSATAP